ncbi:hypothetical protein HYDPIDRAFT_122721 [Hydnomerulius pinastri MD-312]|nr:hypothetical protein HYDPIDRAFT_122721 [Hydnomerulius pinastri MD-312]
MTTTLLVDTVQSPDGFTIDPLSLSIQFTGSALSLTAVPEYVPVRISVHIPDEFVGQILPILECNNSRTGQRYCGRRSQCLSPDLFPFFPLSPTFNLTDGDSWLSLANQIQFHLVQDTQEEHVDEWLLAREFFWMAFVAAFPRFPHGDWPNWDSRISMEGDFISYWMSDIGVDETRLESVSLIREFIWEELEGLAAHSLPITLDFLT